MGILLNPWSLIVIAVVAFLLFFTMGRMTKLKVAGQGVPAPIDPPSEFP